MRRTITALLLAFALLSALARPAFAFAAPVAASFSTAVPANRQSLIQLQGSDADGTTLTYATTSTPSHGALSNLNASTGYVVYTPTTNYTGSDSFTYTVTSGGDTSAAGTVTITVSNAKTTVTETLTDPSGVPRSGKVTFILTQAVTTPAGITPVGSSVSASLSPSGVFSVQLYPSRSMSPAAYYQVWHNDSNGNTQLLGVYDIPAATSAVGLAAYKVTDTNLAARYTFASMAGLEALKNAAANAAIVSLLAESRTTGRLQYWDGSNLADSLVSQAGGTVSVGGGVAVSGTVTAAGYNGLPVLVGDSGSGGVAGLAPAPEAGAAAANKFLAADGTYKNASGATGPTGPSGTAALTPYLRAGLPTPGTPGRMAVVTDECNLEVIDTGREWTPATGVVNVQQCGASGARLATGIETGTTTTSGSTSSGATTLTVASGLTFDNGETVKVTGGGPTGAVYRGVITAGGGTTSWTIYPAVNTAVSSGATVTHGDNNVTTLVTGSASAGATSVTVASASTFKVGHDLYIAGGGASSGGGFLPHIATITNVASNTITFTPALVSGVSANALVMHDDTAPIRAALALAASKRALTLYFPSGTYMANRPNVTGTGGNAGTFLLPEVPCCGDQTVGLDLVGDARPPALQPSFLNHEVSTGGSIIQTDTAGGALFTAKTVVSGNSYGFSMINLRIRNLHFRTYDNPQKRGLDLAWINIAHVDGVGVDTGTPTNRVTQPTNSSAVGLYMPGPLNSAGVARDVYVYGYYKGMVTGEHGDISDTLMQFNLIGYEFPAADYPICLGSIVSNQNTTPFKVTGAARFMCDGLLKSERWWSSSVGPAWTASTYDYDDASDLGRGGFTVFAWDPGTGTSPAVTRNGGKGMLVRHATAPWNPYVAVRNSAAQSIPNATDTRVLHDTDLQDESDAHSTASNTGRINCVGLGAVTLAGNLSFAANAAGTRGAYITKNNPGDANSPYYVGAVSAPSVGAGSPTNLQVRADSTCSAPNQYFEIFVYQDSGGALNLLSTAGPSVLYGSIFTMTYK